MTTDREAVLLEHRRIGGRTATTPHDQGEIFDIRRRVRHHNRARPVARLAVTTTQLGLRTRRRVRPPTDPPPSRRYTHVHSTCRVSHSSPHRAPVGAVLITGTDAGVSRAVFDDFVSSLEFFTHLGCTPPEILDLATWHTAEALGLTDTGTLTPGHRADLLVVGGDPLRDLQALRDVRLVMAAGRVHR
ncbi:amidohydrolase family protein [Streptomyces sp. NPDC005790]|uniref:amidohydrolase family protein n=1 Tax=Streptomyces sp. NPDC005790 TaxID=3154777 RepID=UPI0033C8E359